MSLYKAGGQVLLLIIVCANAWGANYSQIAPRQNTDFEPAKVDTYLERPAGFFELLGEEDKGVCKGVLDRLNEKGNKGNGDYFEWLSKNSATVPWVKIGEGWVDYFSSNPGGAAIYIYRIKNIVGSEEVHQLRVLNRPIHDDGELLRSHAAECRKMEPKANCDSPDRLIKYAVNYYIRKQDPDLFDGPTDIIRSVTSDASSKRMIYSDSGRKLVRNVGLSGSVKWQAYDIGGEHYVSSFPVSGFARPEVMVFRIGTSVELKCLVAPSKWN